MVKEGSDRAILRTSKKQALNKKRSIEYHTGIPAHIFVADKKLDDDGHETEGWRESLEVAQDYGLTRDVRILNGDGE